MPPDLTNAVAVACGYYHSLAVKADGTVVGWGNNGHGEATPPAGLSNVVAVAADMDYSLALKADGTVAVWGTAPNLPGLSNVVAIAGGKDTCLALKADGTVTGWNSPVARPPARLSNVVAIGAADY